MIKHLLLIGLIITIGGAQSADDFLSLGGSSDPVDTVTETKAEELVVDYSLPLGHFFVADGEAEVLDATTQSPDPIVFEADDGEMPAKEHVEKRLYSVWEKNLFKFNDFSSLNEFIKAHVQTEIEGA